VSHTPFPPIVDRGETVTGTGGHRLRSWATAVVALLSTVLGLFPSTSMVWPGSQTACADVAVTVAVNPDHTPTAHLLDYRITAGHSHGPPATINGPAANGHTYYVLAGTAPVLVHNNNNDCEVDVYHAVPDDSVADSVLAGIDWERLNPNSRFGRALYVASRPETAVAEVRHHKGNPGTLMHFKLDLSLAKILDLTNPDMADSLGYRWSGKITEHTQRIGEVARQLGYNVIKYPSLRGGGDNWAIIADFDQLLTYVGRRPV